MLHCIASYCIMKGLYYEGEFGLKSGNRYYCHFSTRVFME